MACIWCYGTAERRISRFLALAIHSPLASDDGYDMGAPEADWVVSIGAGDVVRVWAAGDVQAEVVIVGAMGWAERRVVSDDDQG